MSYIGYVVRGRKSLSGSVVCNKELMVADDRSPETVASTNTRRHNETKVLFGFSVLQC